MQISLNLGTLLATADVSTGRLIGTLLVAIALILFLILKWRVQAFIALLVASVFVGVAAGTMSMTEVGGTDC
jgi:H+/gluconate symporter-like permease